MNLYYIGIDASFTGTGLTILDDSGNVVEVRLISTKNNSKNPYDVESRIINITEKLNIIRNLNYIDEKESNKAVVCIEDISFGSKGAAAAQMAALNYYIRIFLFENGIEYHTIAPSKLKKFATGDGRAKKNLMLKEVYKKWGVDFNDDNECDSYALARYALENYKPPRK